MSEGTLQLIASLKLLIVCGYATLYGLGGMNGKWKRRILGSGLYTIALVAFSIWTSSFSWVYLLVFPLLFGATSIGYGAGTTITKVIKRAYCGLAYSLVALPICLVTGNWTLYILHTIACLGVSITLGVINPVSARYEESLIGATIATLPLFMC